LLAIALCILIVCVSFTTFSWGNSEKEISENQPINVFSADDSSGEKVPENPPIKISCVGDSITEWSGYPANLQNLLGDEYNVGNFGVAGAAVSPSLHRAYMSLPEFQESKESEPSIVIIMLGTNDADTQQSANNFVSDYRELVSEYIELPSSPEIFLVKPPPLYENDLYLSNVKLENFVIPGIEQVADEFNLPIIDINNALDNSEFFVDGVHPNSVGADAITTEIFEAIN
jgi:lysophospholipase L1-like esterase